MFTRKSSAYFSQVWKGTPCIFTFSIVCFHFFLELTPWTPWTPCSKSCGSGEKTRNRECKSPDGTSTQSQNNPCGNAVCFEREICNPQKCPIYTEWSEWSECSVSCDGGKQSRERSCVLPPISGKNLVYIPILTFMSCLLPAPELRQHQLPFIVSLL